MNVLATADVPAPKDRVIMVIDMKEENPLWEFAIWSDKVEYIDDDGDEVVGAWCPAGHTSLLHAVAEDYLHMVTMDILDSITHWMEVPPLPVANMAEAVA